VRSIPALSRLDQSRHPRLHRASTRLAGPLVVALVVVGASVTAVVGRSAAASARSISGDALAVGPDMFRAGEVGVAQVSLPAAAATAQIERAGQTATLLGLPTATRRTAARVVDRFGGRTYDEIAEYDAQNHLLSLQRFETDGRLLAVVRFGLRGDGGPALAESAARQRAQTLVAALGLVATGTPRIVAAPSAAGWTVAWDRSVSGIAVPGDGLRLQLWPDGSVHGLSRSERTLATRPASLLDEAAARTVVLGRLDAWFRGTARGQVTLIALSLAWVPPNDTFAASAPDAPSAVLRLAWVARAGTSGALSENLRALEVYVDAGDGAILGGDILR
jgi:hypothetical protein